MKKILFLLAILAVGVLANEVFHETPTYIFGEDLLRNIKPVNDYKLQEIFTLFRGKIVSIIFLGIAFGVPLAFLTHYLVIGPMVFSHKGTPVYVFNIFHRTIHWLAAISFIVIVPTGLVMIFGAYLGGGTFVRTCKELHAVSSVLFSIVVLPMFFMWVKDMILVMADFKWLMIAGGYLNKRKEPVPAGKFNSGQKTWFWACTFGGMLMVASGAVMYFQDFEIEFIKNLGISQIDLLRISAITHNIVSVPILILFFIHIYMSMYAIKGAVHSMISGYKHEEEVKILHSIFYKELKEKKVI